VILVPDGRHPFTSRAAAFHNGRGYQPVDREIAPLGIAAAIQFASLCPACAAYLVK